MNDDDDFVKAARAAWLRDPATASAALLGDADFVQAIRGCNQYGHAKGCPEANGGGAESKTASESSEKKRKSLLDEILPDSVERYRKTTEGNAEKLAHAKKMADKYEPKGDMVDMKSSQYKLWESYKKDYGRRKRVQADDDARMNRHGKALFDEITEIRNAAVKGSPESHDAGLVLQEAETARSNMNSAHQYLLREPDGTKAKEAREDIAKSVETLMKLRRKLK